MNSMHADEIEDRRLAFERIWRGRYVTPVSRMPAYCQGDVHDMLKEAFKAGSNYERRKSEPTQLGGCD